MKWEGYGVRCGAGVIFGVLKSGCDKMGWLRDVRM